MKSDRWLVAAALVVAALVFSPILGHSFFRDDFDWVARAIDARPHFARWFQIAGTDFRPLASSSFMLNLALSGLEPCGYYTFNLLLHLAVVALLMAFTYRLSGGSTRAAGVAGILFGVGFAHYGEAIYWICGRTGPIADFFMLATLVTHWDSRARDRTRTRALSLTFFGLALLAKETAAILLPLLFVLEWAHPARRGRLGPSILETAKRLLPHTAILAVYLAFTFLGWRSNSPILTNEYVFGFHGVTNLLEYVTRMFLPVTTTSMMIRVPEAFLPTLRGLELGLMIGLPAFWIALMLLPLPRAAKFALLWIPLTLLPVVFFTFRTSARYLYTPAMGVAMLTGFFVTGWTQPVREGLLTRRRTLAAFAMIALLVVAQAGVMFVILDRRRGLERIEGPERWEELRAHAARAGIPPGNAEP